MQELKHNANNVIKIGVVVNSTGVTPVTNLTIDGADEAEILKNETTGSQAISGTLTAIANCDGWYLITLTAAECDTKGPLTVVINDDSACLPVYRDFMIVDAHYYNAKYSTTLMTVNIEAVSGDTAAADTLETHIEGSTLFKVDVDAIRTVTQTATDLKDFADTGYDPAAHVVTFVNVTSISGDTAAADNLEAAYDGTGYIGGVIIPKVDVDSIRGATATANDLKDFADTGYNPTTHMVELVNVESINAVTATADGIATALSNITDILADTNELELDWKDGGRLDLLLDGAAAAGDPWVTAIPGAYVTGTAGFKLGNAFINTNTSLITQLDAAVLDVNISSLQASTQSAADLKDLVDTGYDPATHVVTFVNITSVSGNTAAADNLQAAYDGTGYIGGVIIPKVDIDSIRGATATAVNLKSAYDGTGYVGGTILQKVNVDALQASTQSAADLKDLVDTGYDPVTHKVEANVTGGDATAANQTTIINTLADMKGVAFASATSSLAAIRARGDVAWITGGGGTGANAITITVIDVASAAIPDVDVEIWDNANAVFVTKDDTDAGGYMSTNLDSANYVVRLLKAGYTFANHTLTVAAATSVTYTGTAWVVGTPAAADLCRVFLYAKNSSGTILNGCVGTARITGLPHDDSTSFFSLDEQTGTYATATGLLYWDLVQGATALLKVGDLEIQHNITVPATASVALTTLI